eukprot:1187772-Prorocentrum_minimum.AAC.2
MDNRRDRCGPVLQVLSAIAIAYLLVEYYGTISESLLPGFFDSSVGSEEKPESANQEHPFERRLPDEDAYLRLSQQPSAITATEDDRLGITRHDSQNIDKAVADFVTETEAEPEAEPVANFVTEPVAETSTKQTGTGHRRLKSTARQKLPLRWCGGAPASMLPWTKSPELDLVGFSLPQVVNSSQYMSDETILASGRARPPMSESRFGCHATPEKIFMENFGCASNGSLQTNLRTFFLELARLLPCSDLSPYPTSHI